MQPMSTGTAIVPEESCRAAWGVSGGRVSVEIAVVIVVPPSNSLLRDIGVCDSEEICIIPERPIPQVSEEPVTTEYVVYPKVEVAIVVEVRPRYALRKTTYLASGRSGGIGESPVPVVPEKPGAPLSGDVEIQ